MDTFRSNQIFCFHSYWRFFYVIQDFTLADALFMMLWVIWMRDIEYQHLRGPLLPLSWAILLFLYSSCCQLKALFTILVFRLPDSTTVWKYCLRFVILCMVNTQIGFAWGNWCEINISVNTTPPGAFLWSIIYVLKRAKKTISKDQLLCISFYHL